MKDAKCEICGATIAIVMAATAVLTASPAICRDCDRKMQHLPTDGGEHIEITIENPLIAAVGTNSSITAADGLNVLVHYYKYGRLPEIRG